MAAHYREGSQYHRKIAGYTPAAGDHFSAGARVNRLAFLRRKLGFDRSPESDRPDVAIKLAQNIHGFGARQKRGGKDRDPAQPENDSKTCPEREAAEVAKSRHGAIQV